VGVPTPVEDHSGQVVYGLKPSDFVLLDNDGGESCCTGVQVEQTSCNGGNLWANM
jgi:hypothetical protein